MRLPARCGLLIGDLVIKIAPPPACQVEILNPHYRFFLEGDAVGKHISRLTVRLHGNDWPSLQGIEKEFDTCDSWSTYLLGEERWLTMAPRLGQEPLWIARFHPDMSLVDLYCRARHEGHGRMMIDLPLVYPLDQLLLMHYFARRRGMLAHAAGMVHKGKAYLFAGASGAGKSTFSELLVAAKIGKVLSDERMIVREIEGKMIAFGTPWAGTAGIARNGSAPLAGIFFLKHGKANQIEKLDPVPAADCLLPMISIPWYDLDAAVAIIGSAKRLMARVPAYEMSFTPDRSAADFFWKFARASS